MAQTAVRASDLIGTFGINTHIDYTDGKYANIGATLSALDYLGIHQVREHGPNTASDPYGQTHLGDAANAGLKFVFNASASVDPLVAVQRIHDFVQAHPGSVVGIEGLNEVNNWPVVYNGQTGAAGAVAYQKAFFDAVNADPLLKDIPVIGFTGYSVASASDLTNIHTYAKDGDQPFAWLSREAAEQKAADPGKQLVVTETGYHTSLTADTAGGWEGVDAVTQAKLTLNTLMDSAFLGAKSTFLYELFDAYSDPGGSNQEKHFGLFNLDSSPKAAATAIHNLTAILSDTAAGAGTFTPDALNYTTSGLSSNGHTYLTEKAGGAFQILVWDEPDIWNQNTDQAIAAKAEAVTVSLGATFGSVKVFDPLVGTSSIKEFSNVSSLTVDVVDHPLVIEVSGAGGTTPPVVPPPVVPPPAPTPLTLVGTGKADTLTGAGGDDSLSGMNGNDTLRGGDGNDHLFGGAGNDFLFGDAGNDYLSGGKGDDKLTGGAGADLFVFGRAEGNDEILDFHYAEGDRLDLSGLRYTLATASDGSAMLKLAGGGTVTLDGVHTADFNGHFIV